MQLCPTELEARIRRLKWLQVMAKYPEHHVQVLAAMFGTMHYEPHHTLTPAGHVNHNNPNLNPWAKQAEQDLQSLTVIEDGRYLLEATQGSTTVLFNNYAEDFAATDECTSVCPLPPTSLLIRPPSCF